MTKAKLWSIESADADRLLVVFDTKNNSYIRLTKKNGQPVGRILKVATPSQNELDQLRKNENCVRMAKKLDGGAIPILVGVIFK